ncbi:hypothetical protein GCM10023165_50480 [Variovorax defluvii]|uniref:Universal stress protein n=1 Tax=Variovorax defluvii TaxID=913761 RepID=A0ABP8IE95_9BURK
MVDIHAILALTDFSAQGDRAVLRAAALAQQRGCLLKIMYAPSDLQGAVMTSDTSPVAHRPQTLRG